MRTFADCGLVIVMWCFHLNFLVHLLIVYRGQCFNVNRPLVILADVHDDIAESVIFCPFKRLGKEVTDRFVSWTMRDSDVVMLLHIGNKEVANIHVPGPFAA